MLPTYTCSTTDVIRLPLGHGEQRDYYDSTPPLTRSAKTSSWLQAQSFDHVYVCNLTETQN